MYVTMTIVHTHYTMTLYHSDIYTRKYISSI